MKKIALIACAAMILLAGCNTIRGAGQDVKAVGHDISRAAE